MDKPCGTMGPGEIPDHLLTHLFVSFAYINSDFEITIMDGIDSSIYLTIGNVKARAPSSWSSLPLVAGPSVTQAGKTSFRTLRQLARTAPSSLDIRVRLRRCG